ncbi:MAG: DUF4350 domain-containing protein [Armatimonadetes bacterium]|nr:DUF4350 domain-containing protein [Armatimonadota bacterium]
MRIHRDGWVLILLVVLFVAVNGYLSSILSKRRTSLLPTTYNSSKRGVKALYELEQALGVSVERWEKPYTKLDNSIKTLVVIEPLDTAEFPGEEKAVQHWVKKGGTLVVFVGDGSSMNGNPYFPLTDIAPRLAMAGKITRPNFNPKWSQISRGISKLELTQYTRLDTLSTSWESVASDKWGKVITMMKHGAGREFAVVGGDWLSNLQIRRADNAILLANLITPGPIGFDEFHHGYTHGLTVPGNRRSLWKAIGLAGRLLFFQILALFLLIVYNLNRRLGPAKSRDIIGMKARTDYMAAIAQLHKRAKASAIPLQAMAAALRQEIARDLNVEDDPQKDSLWLKFEEAYPDIGAPTRRAVQRIESIQLTGKRMANESEMMALAKQLDQARRALRNGRGIKSTTHP